MKSVQTLWKTVRRLEQLRTFPFTTLTVKHKHNVFCKLTVIAQIAKVRVKSFQI